MNELDRNKLIDAAICWMREQNTHLQLTSSEITARTPLLSSGLLDSLGLVDLVAFLEKTTGSQIDLLTLNEEELTTLDGLCSAASRARTEQNPRSDVVE